VIKLTSDDIKQLLQYLFTFYRVSELLDYTAEELTGQSLYALCHGEDVHKLRRTHEDCKLIRGAW